MRTCARMGCRSTPVVTIALRYADRTVLVRDLEPTRDPNLLDLCADHLGRMTAPVGWLVDDVRTPALSSERS
jgi:hypothetical protein